MGDVDASAVGERDLLVASLERARHAVLAALSGVPVVLLDEPLIWPDGSLLAIVRHLAGMERWWFAHTFAGLDVMLPLDTATSVVGQYEDECRRSRAITAGSGLDDIAARSAPGGQVIVLRWVLLHMIDETSRHAGHADVLRQLIDGSDGSPRCAADGRDHGTRDRATSFMPPRRTVAAMDRMTNVRRVLAGVTVVDTDAAAPWYRALFGRDEDDRPMDGLIEWHHGTGVVQLIRDPDRAGGSALTLDVADAREFLRRLAGRGIDAGTIDETTSDTVLFATVTDPDGNAITIVESR